MDFKDLKVTKMDKRHYGNKMFSHFVEIFPENNNTVESRIRAFVKLRQWFAATLEQGIEVEFAMDLRNKCDVLFKWAWNSEGGCKRIYMTPEAYTLFVLTWL